MNTPFQSVIFISRIPRKETREGEIELNYGISGVAVWDTLNNGKWDFRPDGLNVSHLVKKKDLFFIDKPNYNLV